ncbi:hypothetical protein CUJ83_02995 [Methanocella sp. CWC-04]|uniref:Tetratricopeptide repeat-containing protein n=1 Tax=Methanooceanicella nereidis TaxID=2052831 RepID=A0AAP2RAX2_9EURY|nr:tetratricopeptide repeat protein [Methanocella sp. CWC-04]MCD1293963.1 hypothetical protein [Methanocella sp. CWC-04]
MRFMTEWEAVEKIGRCIGLEIDETAIEMIKGRHDREEFMNIVRDTAANVFRDKLTGPEVDTLVETVFDTGFDDLEGDGQRLRRSLSYDVFRRTCSRIKYTGEISFEGFDVLFQEFLERFKAAMNGIMFILGLNKEIVSLENSGIKDYVEELRSLPCRRFGELNFGEICKMRPPTSISLYVESLLKKYENDPIPHEDCIKILDMMDKLSNYPNYFRVMDHSRKMEEIKPVLTSIAWLQKEAADGQEKNDLLTALGILLFNIYPSPMIVKYLSKLEPGLKNQFLCYEYNSIMALNYLLMGKLDIAEKYTTSAFEVAIDEEKRAYTCVLKSCVYINRHEHKKAIENLEKCSAIVRNKRMRSMTRFYLGIVHYECGDLSNALECFKDARVGIEDEIDLMNICNNIGTCSMLLGDLKGALNAFDEVEELSRYMGSNIAKFLKSVAYGNMGIVYLNMKEPDKALEYYRKALKVNKEIRNKKGIANQIGNIGLVYKSKQDHKSSIDYFKSMLNYSFSIDYFEGVLFAYGQIDQAMTLLGKQEEAEAFKKDIVKRYPGITGMLKKRPQHG